MTGRTLDQSLEHRSAEPSHRRLARAGTGEFGRGPAGERFEKACRLRAAPADA
jgi:hypothetical protein